MEGFWGGWGGGLMDRAEGIWGWARKHMFEGCEIRPSVLGTRRSSSASWGFERECNVRFAAGTGWLDHCEAGVVRIGA
jgi:hypothetical protein